MRGTPEAEPRGPGAWSRRPSRGEGLIALHVDHLALTDFRSYPHVELGLGPGVTTFVGPNGEGKTNLVEAVGYAATQSSHRVATDAPLVRSGSERAVVRVSVVRDGRPTLLELEIAPSRANRARLNRSPVRRPRELLGVLRTVLFAPEDLALVKGDPGDRRRFLDELLVTRRPLLAAVRGDVDRVLKQRNALLRSAATAARASRAGRGHAGGRQDGRLDLSTLDVWDEHLARAGAELVAARLELVEQLRPRLAASYATVAGSAGDQVTLDYRTAVAGVAPGVTRDDLVQALLDAMAELRRDELDRGVSLVGPQRDDLAIGLGPRPAKGYASHGEAWSLALGLRLASYDLLTGDGADRFGGVGGESGGTPVLVLDDVFAELDAGRRERLARRVATAEQVLVTAAVPADVPDALRGVRVDVAAGQARRVA